MGFRGTGGVSGDSGSEADGENQLPLAFRSFTRLSDGAERIGPARADPSLKLWPQLHEAFGELPDE
jgi:hypothetical protein